MTLASSPVIFYNPTEKFNPFLPKTCYWNTLTYPAHAGLECFAERSEAQLSRTASTPPGSPTRQSHVSLHPSQERCCARGLEDLQDKQQEISDTLYICFSWPRKSNRSAREEAAVPAWRHGWAENHCRVPFPSDAGRFQPSSTPMDPQHTWKPHCTSAQHGIHCNTISVTQQGHLTHLFHTSREDFDAVIDHNKGCLQEARPHRHGPRAGLCSLPAT